MNFYSKLPKGPAPAKYGGIKGRYFNGKNASGKPIVATIFAIFALGYTIDYQSELSTFAISCYELNVYVITVHLSRSSPFCQNLSHADSSFRRTPQEPRPLIGLAGLLRETIGMLEGPLDHCLWKKRQFYRV